MTIALVIPTIREDQALEFLSAWQDQLKEAQVKTYLVEDNAEKTFKIHAENYYQLEHLCWGDAPQALLDCIHVKSPGCRQIGFWKAYQEGCEIIVTLDDDVRPIQEEPNLFQAFYSILTQGLPVWVDPLLNYRSRGYPVENVGRIPVSFHIGSFLGVPDVDGETQLQYEKKFERHPPQYIPRPTLVPYGQLIPVNGGICGWRRELTPFIHYTLWHQELGYRRFDDIWMGVLLKKWMDLCQLKMSYGTTLVQHIRASDAQKNFGYEVEGKKWNEVFWQILNEALQKSQISGSQEPERIFKELCECLKSIDNEWAKKEAQAMLQWYSLFS